MQFFLLFVLMLITAVLETIGIGLIMPFITVMTDPGIIENNVWLSRAKTFIGAKDQFDFLIFMGFGLVFFYILKNIGLGFLNYFQLRFIFSKRSVLGRRLFRTYLYKPFTFHLERNTAELMRNITNETIRVFNFVQSLLKVCSESCVFCAIVIMLLWINPIIVVSSIAVLGILSGIFYKSVSNYLKKLGQRVQISLKYTGQAVLEGLGAIKEVKLANKEEYFPNIYFSNMMDNARANWRYSTISTIPKLSLEIVSVGSVIIIIVLLRMQGHDIKTMLPILSLFAMATIRLMPSLSQIVSNLQLARFDSSAVDIIYDDMKGNEHLREGLSQAYFNLKGSITINNLSYTYPNSQKYSLHDIRVRIDKGQAVAFAGTSGAGKTTLANIILGLLYPSGGGIYVDNSDIFQDLNSWQRNIGYVPQAIYLLDTTVRNNIAFGIEDREIDDELVWKALRISQLEDLVNELPQGLDTVIGENGVRLSGGQRQRIGIARALYHDPDLLVLDEATSSLDGETEREVSRAIEVLSGSKTLIIIAHRLSTIRNCSKIYYMDNGTIIDSGTFEELVARNPDFRRMAESNKLEI